MLSSNRPGVCRQGSIIRPYQLTAERGAPLTVELIPHARPFFLGTAEPAAPAMADAGAVLAWLPRLGVERVTRVARPGRAGAVRAASGQRIWGTDYWRSAWRPPLPSTV